MKDMIQGSVMSHLLQMATFVALSMVVQTLYLLGDMPAAAGTDYSAVFRIVFPS